MSTPQSRSQAGHSTRSGLTIPQFEPLPPNTILNRIINKVLAPLFYLVFTIVTAIIVVPIYTIIENFKHGRNRKGGVRVPSDGRRGSGGRTEAKDFLKGFSSSYVVKDGKVHERGEKKHHGHHHHHEAEDVSVEGSGSTHQQVTT